MTRVHGLRATIDGIMILCILYWGLIAPAEDSFWVALLCLPFFSHSNVSRLSYSHALASLSVLSRSCILGCSWPGAFQRYNKLNQLPRRLIGDCSLGRVQELLVDVPGEPRHVLDLETGIDA